MRPALVHRVWAAWLILLLTIAWAGTIAAAPGVLAGDEPARETHGIVSALRTPIAVVYLGASHICHQQVERSFSAFGRPFPVCARCTGLYAGLPLGVALLLFWRSRLARHGREMPSVDRTYPVWRGVMLVALVPTILSFGIEWGLGMTCGSSRALTAAPLGVAAGGLIAAALLGRPAST